MELENQRRPVSSSPLRVGVVFRTACLKGPDSRMFIGLRGPMVGIIMFSKIFDSSAPDFDSRLNDLVSGRRTSLVDSEITGEVAAIIKDVASRGDEAVCDWCEKLDGYRPALDTMEVPTERIWAAVEQADPDVVLALEQAHERIEQYHQGVAPEGCHPLGPDAGIRQRIVPIQSVGVYVPGGRAAYVSSVLMNVVPARVAGVEEVIMVTPAPRGVVPEAVLAAAAIAGVDRLFSVGGVPAIAALTFGTEHIPRVDKIVGPGNRYVAEAKRQVFGAVGIDMIAGPSEVLVLCDCDDYVGFAAADLIAQAEHDPCAVPMLLVPDSSLFDKVVEEIGVQLDELPRKDIVTQSISEQGIAFIVPERDQWSHILNQIAPEHLELLSDDAEELSLEVHAAGAVFLGPWSPEAVGDYAAGPDHVLPTSGTARFTSVLGTADFCRRMSVIHLDQKQSAELGPTVITLARSEKLEGHARSMEIRLRDTNN